MRIRVILRYCGISLTGVALLMLLASVIALANGRDESLMPLAFSALVTLVTGLFPLLFVRAEPDISPREGYCIVVGAWVAASVFGAFPFLIYGQEFTLVNALFESLSGFTTTGASILQDIQALPRGLQFWRIATSWIGGIGIVTLISLVIPSRSDRHSVLATMETSQLAREYFGGRKRRFVQMMLSIYTGITLCSFLALKVAGLGWFDAITHAMSACSTCGFSTRNGSVAEFNNVAVELVLIVSMLMGATNFSLLFATLRPRKGHGRNLLRSETVRCFLGLVALAILVIATDLLLHGRAQSVGQALRLSAFQVCSLATTTGFATADTDVWPAMSILVLLACSLICGCSGSTSGGIKIDRLLLISKGLVARIQAKGKPSRISSIHIDGFLRTQEESSDAAYFILFYLLAIVAGSLVNALGGLDLRTGVSAAVACVGNVGPGFGDVGSMCSYADFPTGLKLSSMLLMLLGRLEIYPLFLAFSRR